MVILEEGDPGVFDRGTPTKKLVHQLSSTNDPVFNLKVPASRIVGGYTVKDGVIIPNYSHGEIIEAVFRRTRVTVGLMTAAKLLSAVEPVILYQRRRFRGGEGAPARRVTTSASSKRRTRCTGSWTSGPPAKRARRSDLPPRGCSTNWIRSKRKRTDARGEKIDGPRRVQGIGEETGRGDGIGANQFPAGRRTRSETRRELESDPLVKFVRARFARQCALSRVQALEHRPRREHDARGRQPDGRLRHHGRLPRFPRPEMDGRAARGDLRRPGSRAAFAAFHHDDQRVVPRAIQALDRRNATIASERPGTGACTLGTAMQLWLWTLNHVQNATDADGAKLYHKTRQGVSFPLADALCWLLAARQFILDVIELERKGAENPALAEGLAGMVNFFTDLCHAQSRGPRAKPAAFARKLSTATTAIRRGTKPVATPAIAPMNWNARRPHSRH